MKSACVVSIKPLSTALVIDVDIEDEEEEDRDQKRHTHVCKCVFFQRSYIVLCLWLLRCQAKGQ